MDDLHPGSPGFDERAAAIDAGAAAAEVAVRVQASLDRAALIRAGIGLDHARERRDRMLREFQPERAGGLRAAEAELRAARRGYRSMFERVTGLDWRLALARLAEGDGRIAA